MKKRIGITIMCVGAVAGWAGCTVGHVLNAAFGIDDSI